MNDKEKTHRPDGENHHLMTSALFIGADASPKPVLRRLLIPLMIIMILIMGGALALLYQQHRQQLAEEILANISGVSADLRTALDQQASGIAATEQTIAADPGVQKALRERDSNHLLAIWRPLFETLNRENHITHFYFFDKNRVCLLRVHQPERRGDLINRFTAIEAERTGKTSSGIELGPLGTFTLRVVHPVFEGGTLVGYLELGKEIEDVLLTMHARYDIQLAVVIRKEHLNRQNWEDGMRMLGREADWDRLPRNVVSYTSYGRLPEAFASWADHFAGEQIYRETDREVAYDGKDWQVSATPLQDASGKSVSDLLIMVDISAKKAAFARLIALSGTIGALLLALLLGFIYVLLHRTDAYIHTQQMALWESEKKHRSFIESLPIGLYRNTMGPQGRFIMANTALARLFGFDSVEEFLSQKVLDLYVDPAKRKEVSAELLEKGFISGKELMLKRKDGTPIWGSITARAIRDQEGKVAYFDGNVTDITDRKRMEEEILSLSITDQLTGLYNRRGFLSLAGQQLKLSDRNKNGMLLFFADLDLLKWINDALGHEEGDKALIEAANIFRETFRTSDIIARLGGDEFAILAIDIKGTNSEGYTARMQQLIDRWNNQKNREYKLSISMGCAYYDPENPCSIDDLIACADKMMYEQKQNKKSLLLQSASLSSGNT